MCGRFSLAATKEKLQQQLPFVETGDELRVSYNIAPTQLACVVTDDQPNRLQYLAWGLVPHWSADGKNAGKLINARMEGIEEKPSFRIPLRKRRCLVPADSFYEWRKDGSRKIPYRILLKNNELMMLAGLWDVWHKDGKELKTFTIITTDPNAEMGSLHNRMPVILTSKEQQQRWLEASDPKEVLDLLQTPADGILKMYQVPETLNAVIQNSPDLHREVQEQPTLFG